MYNGLQGGATTNFLQPAATASQVSQTPTWGGQLVQPASSGMSLQPAAGPTVLNGGGLLYNGNIPGQPAGGTPDNSAAQAAAAQAAAQQAAAQAAYQQGIEQQYGGAIQGYTSQLANTQAGYPISIADIQNAYNTQGNVAKANAANQLGVYETQKSGVQAQQNLSLAQLADMIRGQNMGLQQQLGAAGAGSSSAVGMGQYALGREQSLNRANIQQQAGSNIANISAQQQAVKANLDPYLASLDAQKTQQLNQVAQNYNNMLAQLKSSIEQAKGEEKARLGLFGQTLSQSAADAIASIDQSVNAAKAAYANSISGAKNAVPGYTPPPLAAAPAPIQTPNVNPFQASTQPVNVGGDLAGGSLSALLKQNQG